LRASAFAEKYAGHLEEKWRLFFGNGPKRKW
jgi:hypothetical protein